MDDYVKLDRATGRIEGLMKCPERWLDLQVSSLPDDVAILAVPDAPIGPETHYVAGSGSDDPRLADRPVLPVAIDKTVIIADDADGATITGIPSGSRFTIDGEDMAAVTGEVSITSPMPATYDVLIECWPYLPWRQTITAG